MTPPSSQSVRWCVLGEDPARPETIVTVNIDRLGVQSNPQHHARAEFASFVSTHEALHSGVRWVWHDTASRYSKLLNVGVRVGRCYDLRLCHQILLASEFVPSGEAKAELSAAVDWSVPIDPLTQNSVEHAATLFDIDVEARTSTVPNSINDALEEFKRQRDALSSSLYASHLSLLLSAESAGALIAAEMSFAGLPWDTAEHERILTEALGPKPPLGAKPERMVELANQVRAELGDPTASLDSPPKLLRSLRAAGLEVASTSQWELAEHQHPAIPYLLQYKKLGRLFSANGWAWLDQWVSAGRYRPIYVPGGVVTGRWASNGGGALQIPRQLRPAIRADEGWLLISADVSQLEPRVLAAMSGDRAMAAAGFEQDLYEGIVATGAVASRQEAKIAVLGAMYGATTGDAGRLMPKLRRAFPQAMRLVDDAAQVGERGGVVSTWLGRSSPPPSAEWKSAQSHASLPQASRSEEAYARRIARDQGRFTRNFVVQGSAAEWALAWLADLRLRLAELAESERNAMGRCANSIERPHALSSGEPFAHSAHLAFFLHDEVIVHAPEHQAEAAAEAVRAAAVEAGRLIFPGAPVDFRLDLKISERSEKP